MVYFLFVVWSSYSNSWFKKKFYRVKKNYKKKMPEPSKVVSPGDFDDWFSLNDTVMGGSSKAVCKTSSKGLSLEGVVVEEKGGFVSCKSPKFKPSMDLSNYEGFELKIDGKAEH